MPDETTALGAGPQPPRAEELLKNRYRLLDIIGEGGMAIVWRAEDTELGRTVAVKILRGQYAADPEFLARFRTEARSAATLNDPGVVGVYDVGEDDGRHFLVLEYVPGRDLKAVIRDEAPLPVERAVTIGARLARAVAAAHREGLVHRDIKPQNVLVAPDGRMKVADFGIARAAASLGTTEPGIVMGTVHYIAPEQAAGGSASTASDVYSLGVVLYEMLTGRVPLDADSTLGVAMKIMNETPEPVDHINPAVPAVLAQIVARAMANRPEQRFESAGELADALENFRRWTEQATGPIPSVPAPIQAGAHRALGSETDAADARSVAPWPKRQVRSDAGREPMLDWAGLGLALLAAIALAGLIPLWMAVIARAQAPDASDSGVGWWPAVREQESTPMPTPLPTVAYTRVPDVLGAEQEEALALLDAAGLAASIELVARPGEALGRVVEQSTPSGEDLVVGTVVKLSISAEGKVTVPRPGPDYASTEVSLQNLGLAIQRRDVWTGSAGRVGSIDSLDPPPGSTLPLRSTVIVNVASGSWRYMGVNFEDNLYLSGADVMTDTYAVGSTIRFTPLWQAIEEVGRDYAARAIVSAISGYDSELGRDEQSLKGERPTSGWTAEEEVVGDAFDVPIDGGAIPGTYGLWIEVFPIESPDAPSAILSHPIPTVRGERVLVTLLKIVAGEG